MSAATVSGISLNLYGLTIDNEAMADLPLGAIEPLAGRAVDGVLGGDFFTRFIVEIDYEANTLVLYDPQNYEYAGGECIPFGLIEMTPFVRASISTAAGATLEGPLRLTPARITTSS